MIFLQNLGLALILSALVLMNEKLVKILIKKEEKIDKLNDLKEEIYKEKEEKLAINCILRNEVTKENCKQLIIQELQKKFGAGNEKFYEKVALDLEKLLFER